MPFMTRLLWIILAPLIWFLHFGLIYTVAGFSAALGLTPSNVVTFGWIATVIAATGVIALIYRAPDRGALRDDALQYIHYITKALAVLSLVAILFQMLVFGLVPFGG
jgi:hypothetical protein